MTWPHATRCGALVHAGDGFGADLRRRIAFPRFASGVIEPALAGGHRAKTSMTKVRSGPASPARSRRRWNSRPRLVGPVGPELPAHADQRTRRLRVADRGAYDLAADPSVQRNAVHPSLAQATGHHRIFATLPGRMALVARRDDLRPHGRLARPHGHRGADPHTSESDQTAVEFRLGERRAGQHDDRVGRCLAHVGGPSSAASRPCSRSFLQWNRWPSTRVVLAGSPHDHARGPFLALGRSLHNSIASKA